MPEAKVKAKAQEVDLTPTTETALVTLVDEDDTALEARAAASEQSLVEQLQTMENYATIVKRRMELLDSVRLAALRRTRPQDWVLFKDKEEQVVALLADSGVNLVAEAYGVVIDNLRPTGADGRFQPEKEVDDKGHLTFRAWCDVISKVNGRQVQSMEASIRDDEEFTGRRVNDRGEIAARGPKALEQDLRAALYTRLRSKAVRAVCGMTRVPAPEIEVAWKGTENKMANARKGHGYGRTAERTAERVAEEGVGDRADKLRDEILRRVGGDEDAARELLVDITKNDEKGFGGFKSTKQFTKDWQLDNAEKRLAAHEVFGDSATAEQPELA
jgi:hypothetical protein